MNSHTPENPFVPQISIFSQPGAIFELRIHLCGLASDVDVVAHIDKLLISGNVQPRLRMLQTDLHVAGNHNNGSMIWTDQPYGRFGRDIPTQLKPGTECVILERYQDGDDFVIRYTVRNTKQRLFDPFQQSSHFYMNAPCNGNPSYSTLSHGVNFCSDPWMNTASPRKEYIVTNQESVFSSNFTNARVFSTDSSSVFVEGISQSIGVVRSTTMSNVCYTDIQRRFCQMPLQDMQASAAFCNTEEVTQSHFLTNSIVPPTSYPFGSEFPSTGSHVIPGFSVENSYASTLPTFYGHPEREFFDSTMPMPLSECPPAALNARDTSLVVNSPSRTHMHLLSMHMNPPPLSNNSHHHAQSTETLYSDNRIISRAVPAEPAPCIQPIPPVTSEFPSSQSYAAHAGVVDYILPAGGSSVFPVSAESSRDISAEICRDASVPSNVPMAAIPAPSVTCPHMSNPHNVLEASLYEAQSYLQDIPTVQGVSRTDSHIASTVHIGTSHEERGISRIPSALVEEVREPSCDVSKTQEGHHISVHTRERSAVLTEVPRVPSVPREIAPAPRMPLSSVPLSVPELEAQVPPVSTHVPKVIPSVVPKPPVAEPSFAFPSNATVPEFSIPILDTKPVITGAIPSTAIPPFSHSDVLDPSSLNTSVTSEVPYASGMIESGMSSSSWAGLGSGSGETVTVPREIVTQPEVAEVDVNVRETCHEGNIVAAEKKEVRFSVPAAQDVTDIKHESASFTETWIRRAIAPGVEDHSAVSTSLSTEKDVSLEVQSKSLSTAISSLSGQSTSSSTQNSTSAQISSGSVLDISTTATSTSSNLEVRNTHSESTDLTAQIVDVGVTLASETAAQVGQSSNVVADLSASSAHEIHVAEVTSSTEGILRTSGSTVEESKAEEVSATTTDAASVVVPALTAAAIDVVQNVLQGESFTDALKHSAGSLVRNLAAEAPGVEARERSIVESTSSKQDATIVEETSASETTVHYREDGTAIQDTYIGEETVHDNTENVQAVAERVFESNAGAQQVSDSDNKPEVVAEGASRSEDVGEINVAKITSSMAEDSPSLQISNSATTTLVSSQTEVVTQMESAAGSTTGTELAISNMTSGAEIPFNADSPVAVHDLTTTTKEQIASGSITSVNEGIRQDRAIRESASITDSSFTGGTAKSETDYSADAIVQAKAEVIKSNSLEILRDEEEAKVNSEKAAAEVYAVDTATTTISSVEVLTKSTGSVSESELQPQSQSQNQTILVHDELTAGGQVGTEEASGAQNPTPSDSNIVPVPASSTALKTSTRQDVIFESQSDTSNFSTTAQSVTGQTLSQESVQESLSLDVSRSVGESFRSSSGENISTSVGESTQERDAPNSLTAMEVYGGITPRQREKQPQVPSIVLLEPSSPVDVVISVPTPSSSSSGSATISEDIDRQSTARVEAGATTSASLMKAALSASNAKEIEAQASVRVMPAFTSSTSLKDVYSPSSTFSPSQYDPPPAYSPARSNTLIRSSTITNLETDANVSVDSQVQVNQTSSSGSHSEWAENKTGSSLAATEILNMSSSEAVKRIESQKVTSLIAVTPSELYPHQRPSLMHHSSSFSDYVEVHNEESMDGGVVSLSDSSNSSVVRVKTTKIRPKPSTALRDHKSGRDAQKSKLCLEDCCVFAGELSPIARQQTEQVDQSHNSESIADVGRTAETTSTQENVLSESMHSERSVDSFIDVGREENTDFAKRVATKSVVKEDLDINILTADTAPKSFPLETIPENNQPGESSDSQAAPYLSRQTSSHSTDSDQSHVETGFLQSLHQDTTYIESRSELRSMSMQDQEATTPHDSRFKNDSDDSIELGYVDVHPDLASPSESISKDISRPEAQTVTNSNLSSFPDVVGTTVPETGGISYQGQSIVAQRKAVEEIHVTELDSKQNVDMTNVTVTQAHDVVGDTSDISSRKISESFVESAPLTSTAGAVVISEQPGTITSQEITNTTQVPTTQVGFSTTTSTSSKSESVLQSIAISKSESKQIHTNTTVSSIDLGSSNVQVGSTEVIANASAASVETRENTTLVTDYSAVSAVKESESSTSVESQGTETIPTSTEFNITSQSAALSKSANEHVDEEVVSSSIRHVNIESEQDATTSTTNSDQTINSQLSLLPAQADTCSSMALESLTTSGQQSREISNMQVAVTSEITVSQGAAVEEGFSVVQTGVKEASNSEPHTTTIVEEIAAQEMEHHVSETSAQQVQISTQSSQFKATENSPALVQQMTTAWEDQNHAVEVAAVVEVEEKGSLIASGTSVVETPAVVTEAQNSVSTRDVELTIACMEDLISTSENSVVQTEGKETKTTTQASEFTTDAAVEVTNVGVEALSFQTMDSEVLQTPAPSKSATTISEKVVGTLDSRDAFVGEATGRDAVVGETETSDQDVLVKETSQQIGETIIAANSDVGSLAIAMATDTDSTVATTIHEWDLNQTTSASQTTVETAKTQGAVSASGDFNDALIHSDVAESSATETNGPMDVIATAEPVSTVDASVTESLSIQTTMTGEQSQSLTTLGTAETSTTVIESLTIPPVVHETVNTDTSAALITTTAEERTAASAEETIADIVVNNSNQTEDNGNSALPMTVQETGSSITKDDSLYTDNQVSTSLESIPDADLSHRDDSQEGGKMIVPSRRDSIMTTSEDSIETTGTIRQYEPTPSGTPIRKFLAMSSPSKATLAQASVTAVGSFESAITNSGDREIFQDRTAKGFNATEPTLMIATHNEEEAHTNVVQMLRHDSRRDFAPTAEEVPHIDVESISDSPVDSHDDEALTIEVQTVTGYSDSRPVSFYSADNRTVELYTPTDDGDTVFHSGSESTPASRAMTSTAEDFYSMTHSEMGDTFISASSPRSITEGPMMTSPETSPPIPYTPATTASSDQQINETRKTIDTYSSSTVTKQLQDTKTVVNQEMSFARNDGGSSWGMFDPSAAFNFVKQAGNSTTKNTRTTYTGKRKSGDFVQLRKF